MDLKQHIISEIRRLAAENEGKAPGRGTFTSATGITPTKWTGVYWARWGDALAEAGFAANALQERFDSRHLLIKIADLSLELGRLPTRAEMRLRRRHDLTFPNHSTISNHFRSNPELREALVSLSQDPAYTALAFLTQVAEPSEPAETPITAEGWVYLLKSGLFYKIGRSDELEARLKSIRVALPEAAVLLHSIRTDDPPGIEAYWHRRFAEKRANGEWFRLTVSDVKAFRKRTFQ